jgi:DNA-binding NarL/FixJ family response regulator
VSPTTRVLVVEDNEVIRGVIRLACEQAPGLEVVAEVEDGTAALEAVRRDRPDVVVLDLVLPGDVQGLDVARRIRADRLPTRILIVTGRTDDRAIFESIRAGADGFLEKTIGVRFIADALERVARGERVFTAGQEHAAVSQLGRMARRTRDRAEAKARLTERELEILEYLALGLTVKQVATRLAVSPRTIDSHTGRVYRKLGVRNRVQAISRAAALDLIELG